ncbi:MAG: hypothetical protein JNK50_00380 [Bacteroidia bacterium]|nr:hypothetical protein [Bacteroidia bacterium]MBN8693080.1 hypothetical protein [Bacteroidota bacterium]
MTKILSHTITFLGTVLLLLSCADSTVEKTITGEFAITSFQFKEDNDLLYCLTLNYIEFYSNGSAKIPGIIDRQKWGIVPDSNTNAKWQLSKKDNKYLLTIISDNKYFNGEYVITFGKNEKEKHLILNLKGNTTMFSAEKSWFNYSENKVDELIKITKQSNLK